MSLDHDKNHVHDRFSAISENEKRQEEPLEIFPQLKVCPILELT